MWRRGRATCAFALLLCLTLSACVGYPAPEFPSTILDQGLRPYNDPDSDGLRWVAANPDDPRTPALSAGLGFESDGSYVPAIPVDLSKPGAAERIRSVIADAARVERMPILVISPSLPRVPNCADLVVDNPTLEAIIRALTDRTALVVLMSQAVEQARCGAPQAQVDAAAAADRYLTRELAAGEHTAVLIGVGPIVDLDLTIVTSLTRPIVDEGADGVAVDIGGYAPREQKGAWALDLRFALGRGFDRQFFAAWDSGRIGDSPTTQIDPCNPADARAGESRILAEAGDTFPIWLTPPGTSDGPCGLAPSTPAGEFSPDLAWSLLGLTDRNLA
jgi:endoglucanase